MALWVCEQCTAAFAVGLGRCPQCGGSSHHEQTEDDMPKISRGAGPTWEGVIEPRHVTYPDSEDIEGEREGDDTEDERESDGSEGMLPPAEDDGTGTPLSLADKREDDGAPFPPAGLEERRTLDGDPAADETVSSTSARKGKRGQ